LEGASLTVKVEILYSPTCANHLMWLEKVKKIVEDIGEGVVLEERNVYEHPEALKKYWSSVWPTFREGYIHYLILVAVNGKVLNWYWDVAKIEEAIRKEMKGEREQS